MSVFPKASSRVSGINVDGDIDAVDGDLIGRDKFSSGGAHVAIGGDRSAEKLVEVLRSELQEKNRQIASLQKENQDLNWQISSLHSVFRMVEVSVSSCVSINDYIIFSHMYFVKWDLHKDFWDSIPKEARKAGA